MANQTAAVTAAASTFPRWIPLLGGVLGSSICGLLLYAASIFNAPLMKEFGLTNREVSLFFAVCCLTFGLVTIPAGRFSDKVGPRKVVLVGGAILTVGYILCGFVTSFWQYVLLFGVVSGFGGGCIYLPPIATAPKWWPDKRALATGFTVVGLGLGSFTMGPLGNWIIKTTSSAGTMDGWRNVHIYVGILMGIMTLLCVLCLKVPPAGYKPAGWNPPAPKPGAAAAGRDFTHEESRSTSQFWMLYASYFCGSFAGLMVIGFLKPIGMEGLKSTFTDPKVVNDYATYAISMLAFANAAVRVLIGAIIEKIGTKKCFISVFALQMLALVAMVPVSSSYILLYVVAIVIGWNYGSMFTLFPSSCLAYYGPTAQGSNYGLVFSAWGLAGFAGPFTGGWLRETSGGFTLPLAVAAVLVAISLFISITIKPPVKKS
jgi:MFS transporter, OFA family, oxalate/formate antiporter